MTIFRIDQPGAGIPVGIAGEGREDISSADSGGSQAFPIDFVITDPLAGSTDLVEILDAPPSANQTLTQVSPTLWRIAFTSGVYGPYRVRLTRTLANGSTTSLIKIAAIASPRGYQYPALGERGDPQASLVNAGAGVVAATERNPGGSVRGYHGFYRKVIELLELLGRRSSVSANFNLASGAASLNVSVANDFQAGNEITQATAITLTNGLDGDHGVAAIKQDSTGYAVTFVAAGRTTRYVGGSVPVTASANLRCRYEFRSVVGQPCLDIYPSTVV